MGGPKCPFAGIFEPKQAIETAMKVMRHGRQWPNGNPKLTYKARLRVFHVALPLMTVLATCYKISRSAKM
jgi:CRISPR/Cas system-associated protein Cas10 (large subunit of type III CRISPR-Cas system)